MLDCWAGSRAAGTRVGSRQPNTSATPPGRDAEEGASESRYRTRQ
jgi:hypothetical protein